MDTFLERESTQCKNQDTDLGTFPAVAQNDGEKPSDFPEIDRENREPK